ncbi:hypothetical protein PAI11_13950 [Patulibacter medicamentivorans]|uniref:Uncharacterized protein n=1 Tax=Patulibacter medicamentivorans TaxID=1097667 RepID=H0E3M3_9ACTN|nr:hypothetical protein PAI11_13950 [Patulibacter medicamentivorans]
MASVIHGIRLQGGENRNVADRERATQASPAVAGIVEAVGNDRRARR